MNIESILIAIASLSSVTFIAMTWLKKLLSWIDDQKAVYQQIIGVLLAAGVTSLTKLLDLGLPLDLASWTTTEISALLVALTAFGIHSVKKAIE